MKYELDYYSASRNYLDRARRCLLAKDPRYLFYAAFELRCCIEARQDEYLEAQKKYRRNLPRSWEAGKKQKELNRIFSIEKIQKVTYTVGNFIRPEYYVPVSKSLHKSRDKLGNFLHAGKRLDPEELKKLRTSLISIYKEASTICSGRLLCPLLLEKDGKTRTTILFDRDDEMYSEFMKAAQKGSTLAIKVEYLDEPPSDWKFSLHKQLK